MKNTWSLFILFLLPMGNLSMGTLGSMQEQIDQLAVLQGQLGEDPTRRDVVKGIAVAVAGLMAGCSGKDKEKDHKKEEKHESHDHSDLIKKAWAKEEPMVREIRKNRLGFQGFLKGLNQEQKDDLKIPADQLATAIKEEICEDEMHGQKIDEKTGLVISSLRTAGSGIILTNGIDPTVMKPNDPRYKKQVAMRQNEGKVEVQTSHDYCGAARVAYGIVNNISGEELKKVPNQTIVNWSKEWHLDIIEIRKELLKASGQHELASKLRYEHIPYKDGKMRRPKEVHTAQFTYAVLDEDIDPISDNLPVGYVVSGHSGIKEAEVIEDAAVSVVINMGEHGPGGVGMFTPDQPMHIVALAHDKQKSENFVGNMKRRQQKMPDAHKRLLKVEGATL